MSGLHYLPLTEDERQEMLQELGVASVDHLFTDIPEKVKFQGEMDLPPPLWEVEAEAHLSALAARNYHLKEYPCFLGAGVYDHFSPAVVKPVLSRSEFYTSYTPYQAEVSQGVLQSIFEYQTMICQLTGMEAANASMYDGATAVAEAAVMSCRITHRDKVLVSRSVHPAYRQVLQTYFDARDLQIEEIPMKQGHLDLEEAEARIDQETAALIVQNPNFLGRLEDYPGLAELIHGRGGLLIATVDPISLPLVKAPAEYGADLVAGEGQSLGNPPAYGGPLLGFFAAREKYIRRMPGRISGQTVDSEGNRGFVMTMQTREQHIRRGRATSNICTNQALNALAAAVYLAALGPQGLKEVAYLCFQKAAYAREKLTALTGYQLACPGNFFKEFPVTVPGAPQEINRRLLQKGIIGGLELSGFYPELENSLLFCVTEKRTRGEIDELVRQLEGWK